MSAPLNLSTGVSTTPQFSWSTVPAVGGYSPSSYRILVGTSYSGLPTDPTATGGTGVVFNDMPINTYDTPASGVLSPGTTYYWEVHARGYWYGTWSSIYSFTTAADTTPPTVNLTSPNSGTFEVGSQMTMTATASDASGISYCAYSLVKGGTLLGIIYEDSAGSGMVTSYTWTVPPTFDGYTINGTDYQILVSAWDASPNHNLGGALSSGYLTLTESHPAVPAYSSKPGAPYTIYLDFGGFAFTGNW